ncbi:hypothetical protein C8Q76DRAFT_694801 [Earliella scabrosa]|nr:hypothetical protein C8Q76DRAFT_694801 [Earliella scabrosa]
MAAQNQQELGDSKTQPATPHLSLSSLTTTSRIILPAVTRISGLSLSIAMIVKTPPTAGVDNNSQGHQSSGSDTLSVGVPNSGSAPDSVVPPAYRQYVDQRIGALEAAFKVTMQSEFEKLRQELGIAPTRTSPGTAGAMGRLAGTLRRTFRSISAGGGGRRHQGRASDSD